MSAKRQANDWESTEIRQIRRFLLNLFLKLFVEGDSPEEREAQLRNLCGDPRESNGTIAGYNEKNGPLPYWSHLLWRERGAPGIVHCGWHPICSLIAGNAAPSSSQLTDFKEKKAAQLSSRRALEKMKADADCDQLAFLHCLDRLDRLADALFEFRLAQIAVDGDLLAATQLLIRDARVGLREVAELELLEPIEKLLQDGCLSKKHVSPKRYPYCSAKVLYSHRVGLSEERRVCLNEAVGCRVESKLLRVMCFASGAVQYKDGNWRIGSLKGAAQIARVVLLYLFALALLCVGFGDIPGVTGLAEFALTTLVVAVYGLIALYFYGLFIWPSQELRLYMGLSKK